MARTATARKIPATAALTLPALAKGEIYAGAIVGADGKGHHVILLPGDESLKWKSAMAWAKKMGSDLPDRVEQALLFRDHKAAFQEAWYWSNTTHARYGDSAWSQDFGYGYQGHGLKGYDYRCRAVRRVAL